MASQKPHRCVCVCEIVCVGSELRASSVSTWRRDLDLQCWKSVTVLLLEFCVHSSWPRTVCKRRMLFPTPRPSELMLYVCVHACVCLSSWAFMTVWIWKRAKENHFVSAGGQFASRRGLPPAPSPPSPGYARSLLFVCINTARSGSH